MFKITTICLIRHGETEWNALRKLQGRTDIPLNNKGIQQAHECRDYLKDSEFDALITSPLKRARQTADIINEALDLPIIEMDELQERFYGDAEGMTKEERVSAFPVKNYSNQESLELLNNRVIAGIDKIYQNYPDKKILLVAHGGVINSILSTLSNGEIGSGKTRLLNACISNVHFHEEKWVIKDYNQINHLSNSQEN